MPLARLPQADFSAGEFRGIPRHQIPARGAYNLENALLEGADPYRRGGLLRHTETAFGDGRLSFVWYGRVYGGWRTLYANPTGFAVVDEDGGVTELASGGLSTPQRPHVIGRFLVLDGGRVYAGATLAGNPFNDFQTVAVTNGSRIVTGTGTSFLTTATAGSLFSISGERPYIVEDVLSDTSIELVDAYGGSTASGQRFGLVAFAAAPYIADTYGVVGKRLAALETDRLHFSDYDDLWTFQTDNFHEIPGGVELLGCEAIGDSAGVFTTDGLWTVDNFSLEPVDDFGNVQHVLRHVQEALILWGRQGIAHYAENLVVPARDGIWMVGPGTNNRIDHPLGNTIADYVSDGCVPGLAAITRSHYFLPILRGSEMVDQLVCRLDQPDIPWTHFSGRSVFALAAKPDGTLLAAADSPYLYEAHYLDPDADAPDDDGTAYAFEAITRDYATGQGNKNQVRWIDLDYDLVDTQENNAPTIDVDWSDTTRESGVSDWGGFDWGEADWFDPDTVDWHDTDPATVGEDIDFTQPKLAVSGEKSRARYFRVRLRSSGRVAKLQIRALVLWVRQSTKAD